MTRRHYDMRRVLADTRGWTLARLDEEMGFLSWLMGESREEVIVREYRELLREVFGCSVQLTR